MSQEHPEAEAAEAAPVQLRLPEEPTVGTGSAVAIGCVIVMVLILGVGILIVLWTR